MRNSILFGLLIVSLSACASGPAREPALAGAATRDDGYLASGPTVGLADAPGSSHPTTLQLLEDRVKENAQLKEQIAGLESALAAAEERARKAEAELGQRSNEADQLRQLIEKSVTREKELLDEVLKSRIARLKLEQELLRGKLAELVKEGE